jgi:hypothetical protein
MINDNPYIPHVDTFTSTKEFSYLAEFFNEQGMYTNKVPGTIEYMDFWKKVHDDCVYGITNSAGVTITGAHFFYLNFCPILGHNEKTGKKSKIFPRFVDLDYEFFHMIEYCRLNQKCMTAVKGRRQGWSYKAAAVCSHEFTFYPDSRAVIGAFYSNFSQNTMNMAVDNLNFLNANTEFRKQRNPDLKDYVMARYQADIGGVKVWKGYQSSVKAISFKDNPTAAVGLSANWLILDEAGVFNNIVDSYGYTEPLIKDGNIYTGVALVFGSSGDMDSGSKYFYEMFTNPAKYNMLEFDNPDNPGNKIAFFSSAAKGRWGICRDPKSQWYKKPMVDSDGNSNIEAATDDILFERTSKKNSMDSKALHNITTQFPLHWKEAFLRNKGTVFASIELLDWLGKVETTESINQDKKKGELYFDSESKIKFRINPDLIDITNYPLGKEEPKEGCVVLWEDPINNPPYGLYIAGCDPYDQDKATTSESLGSFFVYKRFMNNGHTYDQIVAEFTGRPNRADDFYETCRRLCIYYNAKCLYENQLKGLKIYFEQKNSLHYLCEQPAIIKDIVKNSNVNRGYGIHMSEGIKDQCEIYVKQWLYEEREDIDGQKIMNLHTIKSIPLLKELVAYDREVNTDRVVAFMLCILQSKELHKLHLDSSTPQTLLELDPFFTQTLFKKNTYKITRN